MVTTPLPSRHAGRRPARSRVVFVLLALLLVAGLVLVPVLAAQPDQTPNEPQLDLVLRDDKGVTYELNSSGKPREGSVIRIGRGRANDIRLEDPNIDGLHAQITVTADGRLKLESLDPQGGTFVNGARVLPVSLHTERSVWLQEGDRLGFGLDHETPDVKALFTLHLVRRDAAPLPASMGTGELAVRVDKADPKWELDLHPLRELAVRKLWPVGFSEPKSAIDADDYVHRMGLAGGVLWGQRQRFEWRGESGTVEGSGRSAATRVTRFYFNALPARAGGLAAAFKAELDRAPMPFLLTAPMRVADARVNANALALTVERSSATAALAIVQRVLQDPTLDGALANGYPALTKPVAVGVSVASFGDDDEGPLGDSGPAKVPTAVWLHRQPRQPGTVHQLSYMDAVNNVLSGSGIDPYHPWGDPLDLGGRDSSSAQQVPYKDYSCATGDGGRRSYGTIRVKFGEGGWGRSGPTIKVGIYYIIKKQGIKLPSLHDEANIRFEDSGGESGTVQLTTAEGLEDGDEHRLGERNEYVRRTGPEAGSASFDIVFDSAHGPDRRNCSVTIPHIYPISTVVDAEQVEYRCGIRGDLDGYLSFEFADVGSIEPSISRIGYRIKSGSQDSQKGRVRVYDDERADQTVVDESFPQDNVTRYIQFNRPSWDLRRWRFVFKFGRNNWRDAECVAIMTGIP